jgi:hypothetical protein
MADPLKSMECGDFIWGRACQVVTRRCLTLNFLERIKSLLDHLKSSLSRTQLLFYLKEYRSTIAGSSKNNSKNKNIKIRKF